MWPSMEFITCVLGIALGIFVAAHMHAFHVRHVVARLADMSMPGIACWFAPGAAVGAEVLCLSPGDAAQQNAPK